MKKHCCVVLKKLPPKKTCVRYYSNFIHCDCCDCNLKKEKQKTKETPIYIKNTIVMSRFRDLDPKLMDYCIHVTRNQKFLSKKSLNVFIFVHYGHKNKIVLD